MNEAELVSRCPSTHCERRGECCSPSECIVKSGQVKAALVAVKSDPMACHSISVWEQIHAALAT